MAPLFKEATLGAIDLGEEEFIEACKNLIKNSTLPQRFLILNRHLADKTTKPSASPQLTGKPSINPVSHVLSFNNDYANSDVFERLALGRELYLKGKAPPASKKKSLPKPPTSSKKTASVKPGPPKKPAQTALQADTGSEHLSEPADEQQEEHSHNLNEEEGNSGGSPEKIYKQQSQISERPSEQNVTSDPENTHPYAGEHGEEEHHEAAQEEQETGPDEPPGAEEEQQADEEEIDLGHDDEN